MKLVIMTQSTFFVEEDKILTTLFDEGMENLHLCKPGASPMYSERLLSLLPETLYGKTTVHDHYYLKNEYGLAGIHIDDPEMPLPKDYRGKFSRTCKTFADIINLKRKAEYVFLDGTFSSAKDEPAHFTVEELEKAATQGIIDKHVYALGGINLDTIKCAKDIGFGGVVVCEDLWERFDIHNQQDYKDLIAHFEKLRKVAS